MIDIQASERFMAAPWLGEVDSETKRAILTALVEAKAPSGAILLAQDQPNDHLSFLIEGTASIERVLASGRREVITLLHGAGGLWIDVVFPAAASERLGSRDFGRVAPLALSSRPRGTSRGGPAGGRIARAGRAARPLGAIRPDG